MKQAYFLLLLIFIAFSFDSTAQVHKRFLNKDNKITKDSTKAVLYELYQKIEQDSSYYWSAVEFNKRGMVIMRGSYLDEELTIPYGKFVYYNNIIEQHKVDEHHSSIDTVLRISQAGYYLNGYKEGMWLEYDNDGKKKVTKNYKNGFLDGLYETYGDSTRLTSQGYFVKGAMEGIWNYFRSDSSISSYSEYWHGSVIRHKEFEKNAIWYGTHPGFNFKYFVYRRLKKLGLPPSHGNVLVSFVIAEDGKLIKPEIKMGLNPDLDKAILEAMNDSPKWVPAKLNRKKVEEHVTLAFNYEAAED